MIAPAQSFMTACGCGDHRPRPTGAPIRSTNGPRTAPGNASRAFRHAREPTSLTHADLEPSRVVQPAHLLLLLSSDIAPKKQRPRVAQLCPSPEFGENTQDF